MNTGRNDSTGPAVPRPNAPIPQPHWKSAVITPNVAAAASRFITAAVAGISRPRKVGLDRRGEVGVGGGVAADVYPKRRPLLGRRDRGGAQGGDQRGGGGG